MKAWRGPGLPHSSVFIPVPEAEEVVGRWRNLFDPMAAAGVPAHVTVMVPWLVPEAIDDGALDALGEVLGRYLPFDFGLTGIGWFGRRVLWLAPDPTDRFLALTAALAEQFGTVPWGGEFATVVPHLTVAHTIEGAQVERVAEQLATDLPVACSARAGTVMLGDGVRWWERASLRFG